MKLQNNFIKGKMNKELDERLIPKGEYIDALNIRVLNTSGSDVGAIENVEGNKRITNIGVSNNPECIGSVTDEANDRIYWFVVNDSGHSYVFEYDVREGVVTDVLKDERTGTNQVLRFDKNYKITGANIIYNISNRKYLLVFTDNLNPPRCINIERAKSYGLNGFQDEDISLYKKPPRQAMTVAPFNTANATENAVRERFFAFAYRYKYLDGEYSALSSFTEYQFTPGIFDLDYETMENKGMVNVFNAYNLTFNTGDKRVTDIQICFKNPGNDNVYVIDTINKQDYAYINDVEKTYAFDNTKVYNILPEDEIKRTFDNVPLTAKAQDFIENRLIFGNITDQYDLVETEGEEDYIKFDYSAQLETIDVFGKSGPYSISANEQQITLNLSGISLVKGYLFYLGFNLESTEVTGPPAYFGGEALGEAYVELTKTHLNVTEFYQSDDFLQLLETLNAVFAQVAETTNSPGTTSLTYGTFSVDTGASNATSLVLNAPIITHNGGTPSLEQFKWQDETEFSVRESSSVISLKSNRSYELGIVYLDKFGRYSSVIPTSSTTGQNSSEIFVPVNESVNINRPKITINHKPPYWADRYKFFIKGNKSRSQTLYATIFYEQGVYRWVLLTGNNAGKVEPGMNLLVKSDSLGPLTREVKVKVLDVETKSVADTRQITEDTAEEGWLQGNTDAAGDPIEEIFGTYMKIKPVGFQMDFNSELYNEYEHVGKIKRGINSNNRGNVKCFLPPPSKDYKGLLQYEDDAGAYQNISINENTKITFTFYSEEDGGRNSREFKKEYFASNTYSNDNTTSALEKFMIAETTWEKPGGQNYYKDPDDFFRMTFAVGAAPDYRHSVTIQSTEDTGLLETARIEAKIQIIINSEDVLIFETDPEDLDNEVHYETSQSFDIENGLHKGNLQDQTSSLPAQVLLKTGNCISFGNGAESMFVKDERLGAHLDFDLRPNIVLVDGYKRRDLTNTLIYSGAVNPQTSYSSINEFNASRGISKLIDAKYGSIQKLHARDNDLIVFQEDKVQKVLYGKSLLYASDGSASLTSIEDVLGQEVPFQGDFGISKNPESFAKYGASMFFTDATRGMVLRLDNQGIEPISFNGMKSYFKENLFEYKNKFNLGGYDPNNNEYVLSMNHSLSSGQVVPLELFKSYDCNSVFKKSMDDTTSYTYKVEFNEIGTLTFNHVIVGSVNISITDPNDNTINYNNRSGTGSFSFNIDQGQLDIENFYTVTITANEDSEIEMAHSCPVNVTRDVVIYVLNDNNLADQTIINTYRVGNGSDYGQMDVFTSRGVCRDESFTESVESQYVPKDGDTITMTSLKQIGIHTAIFNDASSMGYLISSADKTAFEVSLEATYPSTTFTQTLEAQTYEASFTFNETSSSDKLYLIYNYGFAGVVEDEGGEDSETGSGSGGSGGIEENACLDNVHTFYIGGALASVSALENGGPFNVSTQVKGEGATIAGNENTTICQGTSEFTYTATAFWIVLTSPNTNFDPANGFDWWEVSTTGVVLSTGTVTGSGGGGNP